MKFTYIGGPTVLIESSTIRLLTDPTFDPPGSYELPGRTLTKLTGPALRPEQVLPVDIVLLSHDHHRDNLDHAGRELLSEVPTVVTTRSGAERLGAPVAGLEAFEERIFPIRGHEVSVRATPARHGPPGTEDVVGDVIGFLVRIDDGPTLYISGDTVLYDDLYAIKQYAPAIGMLHVGSASTRGMVLTMNAAEAAELARALGLRHVVPVHFEQWAHINESAEAARESFAAAKLPSDVHWLAPGAGTTIALQVSSSHN